jgi:hypothetical protein
MALIHPCITVFLLQDAFCDMHDYVSELASLPIADTSIVHRSRYLVLSSFESKLSYQLS